MLKYWPILFLVIPISEVYLLIEVGSVIGAGWTILLVVMTAVIGVNLLRQQGLSTLMRANQSMSQGQIPAMEMMEGLFLAVGGALLITPGFFTDTIGFICLLPFTRREIIKLLLLKSVIKTSYTAHQDKTAPKDPHTIEGEYHRED
ncbi:FxsA protein [hydrothermal vent metagenome]|uniref:FxsA protein n=1 Tax=hydrothermal vent metagenome TaxID=652676 RepID=A0A3B0WYB4_9ZZZZ